MASLAKRRDFLRFLAASPLAAALASKTWAQQSSPAVYRAADALSVSDFEALTRGLLDGISPATRHSAFVPHDPNAAGCTIRLSGPLADEAAARAT